ncbi:MAG: hypothetical protein Kow0056_17290 [Coriobacteriia bacterium]
MSDKDGSHGAVAARLVELGRSLERESAAQVGGSFTDIEAADALVKSDPNAFLLAVLFTQGIPAERAWAGPFLLRERLGHLDLERLASEQEAVAEAVACPPALHRFVNTLPVWISSAASILVDEWGGDASSLWESADISEVLERLERFPGIGRKKAAMAAEILARHFGVPLDREGGRVAYDVQVRRVFLRSGLASDDSPRSIEEAAVRCCPEAPGLLDLPAWTIGRRWCRPSKPQCDDCPLGDVCPRFVERCPQGVGVRRGAR